MPKSNAAVLVVAALLLGALVVASQVHSSSVRWGTVLAAVVVAVLTGWYHVKSPETFTVRWGSLDGEERSLIFSDLSEARRFEAALLEAMASP